MRPRKVLVLGDDTQSFLAVVRSLGRKGIEVHAVPFNYRAPALTSRYIQKVHRLPRYHTDGEDWCAAVEALLEKERFDYVVPVDDRNILCFQRFRERVTAGSRIVIPSDLAIDTFYDKKNTRELASRFGIPIPPGRVLRQHDTAAGIERELSLPVVLKPRRSYTLDSLHHRGKVSIARTEASLRRSLDGIAHPDDYLVESFFQGRGVGISVLASKGEVLYAFEHHRVTEALMGGSTLRVSAECDPQRLSACQLLIEAVDYTGVAMFEFRQDFASGRWVLLEVNARFWGSLPLPLSLGLDYPYDLLLVWDGLRHRTRGPYPRGVFGRNLVSDLYTRMQGSAPGRGAASRVLSGLAELASVFSRTAAGIERSDTFVKDDPVPGFVDFFRMTKSVMNKLLQRALAGSPIIGSIRRWGANRALAACDDAGAWILFLCQGNICRSPFAHRLLQQKIEGKARVTVTSRGLLPLPNRQSPEVAVRVAAHHGIDLTDHRSRMISDQDSSHPGVVVVFDRRTFEDYRDRFPEATVPVLHLGHLLTDDSGDIEDPFGGDVRSFTQTFARIECAVSDLARKLLARCA